MRAEDPLVARIRWLIALRWLAIAALFLVISGAHFVARLDLPLGPLFAGNLLLAALNGIYLLLFKGSRGGTRAAALANVQISLDLLLLTYLIHFSGGMVNPFVSFFIFHMVIASILLSNRAAYLQASLAAAALALDTAGEQLGILQSYSLAGFALLRAGPSVWPGLVARWSVLAATLFITVYVSTTIVNALRRREEELEKLNLKLEESDRIKSRYVLTVSHDIRSPLAAIQSLLRVVRDGFAEPVPAKARELIERAELRSRQLLSYVRRSAGSLQHESDGRDRPQHPEPLGARGSGNRSIPASAGAEGPDGFLRGSGRGRCTFRRPRGPSAYDREPAGQRDPLHPRGGKDKPKPGE